MNIFSIFVLVYILPNIYLAGAASMTDDYQSAKPIDRRVFDIAMMFFGIFLMFYAWLGRKERAKEESTKNVEEYYKDLDGIKAGLSESEISKMMSDMDEDVMRRVAIGKRKLIRQIHIASLSDAECDKISKAVKAVNNEENKNTGVTLFISSETSKAIHLAKKHGFNPPSDKRCVCISNSNPCGIIGYIISNVIVDEGVYISEKMENSVKMAFIPNTYSESLRHTLNSRGWWDYKDQDRTVNDCAMMNDWKTCSDKIGAKSCICSGCLFDYKQKS